MTEIFVHLIQPPSAVLNLQETILYLSFCASQVYNI